MSFDALAPVYDRDFTDTHIGRWLRARVHKRLARHFGAGARVLELGCGTGEDALLLAERGVRVWATDASPAMLTAARAKTAGQPNITIQPLDMGMIPAYLSGEAAQPASLENLPPFDGVFSNFGALNCLPEWDSLAAWLARQVKPGGVAAFGIMSPLCLWEIGWHSLHGDFATAFRRLRHDGSLFRPSNAESMTIHYPTIRQIERAFAPYFSRIHASGLGLFLPPSDVYGVVEKRPRTLAALIALERRFARFGAALSDHYWIEFRRESR